MNKYIFWAFLTAAAFASVSADDLLDGVLKSKSEPTAQETTLANPQDTMKDAPVPQTGSGEIKQPQVTPKFRTVFRQGQFINVPDKNQTAANNSDVSEHVEEPAVENAQSENRLGALSLRYGASQDSEWGGVVEIGLTAPFENSDFGIAARITILEFEEETGYSRNDSYRYEWDSSVGADGVFFWRPIHDNFYTPFVALGIRYEDMIYELDDEYWRYHQGGNYVDEEWTSTGISFHIGCILDFDRINILVEYMIGPESSELRGDLTLKLSKRIGIFAFAEKTSLSHVDYTSVGGGLSFYF